MGAVQKLATMVIVGLVGLASLLVVYLANEPNRRGAEAEEQEEVAVERGIETFLANCVTCHGPGGEGASRGDGRVGMALGGDTELGRQQQELNQGEDPVERQERYDLIVETLHQGRGLMPAFGRGAEGGALLNDEQIYELATMIQHVDWDVVYNEAIAANDGVYPPAPPLAEDQSAAQSNQTGDGGANSETASDVQNAAVTIEAFDIGWESGGQRTAPNAPITVTVAPGATIALPNVGASAHNFAIDEFDNLVVDMPPGETVDYTVPAETPPGEYRFYCNLPGHEQAGMVGTLVVDPAAAPAPAAPPAAGQQAATPAASPSAVASPAAAQAPAPAPLMVAGFDIGWESNGQRTAPNQPITITASPGGMVMVPNIGAAQHNFVVDALGIKVEMPVGGEPAHVVIPADAEPGEYEFYCSYPGHKQAGMVGTLVVQ